MGIYILLNSEKEDNDGTLIEKNTYGKICDDEDVFRVLEKFSLLIYFECPNNPVVNVERVLEVINSSLASQDEKVLLEKFLKNLEKYIPDLYESKPVVQLYIP